jgi:hypothetical protein
LETDQQISEDDLCTVVAALYPKEYQTKLEALLNSKYLKPTTLLACAHELYKYTFANAYDLVHVCSIGQYLWPKLGQPRNWVKLDFNRRSKYYFQILRRRNTNPTTSSMNTFCRNICFWFCVWFRLLAGCGDSTSNRFGVSCYYSSIFELEDNGTYPPLNYLLPTGS